MPLFDELQNAFKKLGLPSKEVKDLYKQLDDIGKEKEELFKEGLKLDKLLEAVKNDPSLKKALMGVNPSAEDLIALNKLIADDPDWAKELENTEMVKFLTDDTPQNFYFTENEMRGIRDFQQQEDNTRISIRQKIRRKVFDLMSLGKARGASINQVFVVRNPKNSENLIFLLKIEANAVADIFDELGITHKKIILTRPTHTNELLRNPSIQKQIDIIKKYPNAEKPQPWYFVLYELSAIDPETPPHVLKTDLTKLISDKLKLDVSVDVFGNPEHAGAKYRNVVIHDMTATDVALLMKPLGINKDFNIIGRAGKVDDLMGRLAEWSRRIEEEKKTKEKEEKERKKPKEKSLRKKLGKR